MSVCNSHFFTEIVPIIALYHITAEFIYVNEN